MAGPFQDGLVGAGDRPPIDIELAGDGGELRRADGDPPAWSGAGTQQAIGIRAGIVEQIVQEHGRSVQRGHRAQGRRTGRHRCTA